MSNPISGAGAGAKVLQQQLQQIQQQQQMQQQTVKPGGGSFAQKLNQTQQTQQVNQVQEAQKSFKSIRPQKLRTNDINKTQRVQNIQKSQKNQFNKLSSTSQSSTLKGIADYLRKMDASRSDLDNLIKQALSGKKFNQRQLLILQYKIANFSIRMDLTSKVVEKATSGIKQAMNTQV